MASTARSSRSAPGYRQIQGQGQHDRTELFQWDAQGGDPGFAKSATDYFMAAEPVGPRLSTVRDPVVADQARPVGQDIHPSETRRGELLAQG
jgi:hypothetical protein